MASHAFFFISVVKKGDNVPWIKLLYERHASAKMTISPFDQLGCRGFSSVIIADDNELSESNQYAYVAFVVRIVLVSSYEKFQT